ncbi:MAG: aminoacyl-tRNA hydrolase [Candidatus Riflebacteria bacterium]|nr:aminoacyl-tRNA hydrolase [Candidatus Riflebacteria bacterium]
MLIAGLGNPGDEYSNTRHNIGFRAIDTLVAHFKCISGKVKHRAITTVFNFKGDKHFLAKPQTYMNLSGDAVGPLLEEMELKPEQLLVIVDDINLPIGKWRLRPSGGHGGHNGLKSIIGTLGEGFWRLRIGVGLPDASESQLTDHVLGNMTAREKEVLEAQMKDLPEIICMILVGMGQRAMGRFNNRNYAE